MFILSIDGGGVRGIAVARILERLSTELPGWLDKVDLFTGASTGGILATGLADGMTPNELVSFYEELLPQIFKSSWWRKFSILWCAKYSNATLEAAVNRIFGDKALADLKGQLLVPTYYLGSKSENVRARPKFYDKEGDPETLCADLCMFTSAAPTIFSSYKRHVDGGLSANNCSVCAIAFAESKGAKLDEIKVLSISTGRRDEQLTGGDKGIIYWGSEISGTIIDAGVDVANYQAMRLLGSSVGYHRIQPVLPYDISFDDASAIEDLLDMADSVLLDETIDWIRGYTDVVAL